MLERLFVYGSLQPGGPNEHVMNAIGGDWEAAVIRGRLIEAGWGANLGYPALLLDEAGAEVAGHVFSSTALRDAWAELDAFEGYEYARVEAIAQLSSGTRVDVHVYVLKDG